MTSKSADFFIEINILSGFLNADKLFLKYSFQIRLKIILNIYQNEISTCEVRHLITYSNKTK